MTDDRGRDVTRELTAIRTVLSRAETAIAEVSGGNTWYVWELDPDHPGTGRKRVVESVIDHDPDYLEMLSKLKLIVSELSKWRKTGPPKKCSVCKGSLSYEGVNHRWCEANG